MKKFEKFVAILMLVFAVGFNLWLYRLEPTSSVDPNDNAFQFALIDRTSQIWDFANKTCPKNLFFPICHFSYLIDHWVPNWAEGYNLPFYYSHLPQITIVASYKFIFWVTSLFGVQMISLFAYYHVVIYLLLSLFPISVFLALRVVGLPWLTAGIGALISAHVSTDGLYGLDPPSYLWRGWGLSSQLFAQIFLPLAIAYSYKYFSFPFTSLSRRPVGLVFFEQLKICLPFIEKNKPVANLHLARNEKTLDDPTLKSRAGSKNAQPDRPPASTFWLAVFFLLATTAGHLGIGMMAMLSLGVFVASDPLLLFLHQRPGSEILRVFKTKFIRLILLASATLFFLSYWIVPVVLGNNYHNISFWDPIWKFNSYGWKEISKNFFNGDLFDFGRPAIFTILVLLGLFVSIFPMSSINTYPFFPFSLLFVFWMLLYFGRTTWGGLIDLIPGMTEQHLSRFIVGVQLAGLFLAPLGLTWFIQQAARYIWLVINRLLPQPEARHEAAGILVYWCVLAATLVVLIPPVYRQTMRYNDFNNILVKQANDNFAKVKDDVDTLFATLRPLVAQGRVFAGRGGWWGRDLVVAETPYYMHLSTYGIPTVLWLPETWSMNSDTEQYFSENLAKDYDLYNMRYVVAPPGLTPQLFWKPIKETTSWKLYEVATSGYFTLGVRQAIVASTKTTFNNVVRLWIQSDDPAKGLFPQLTFDKGYPKTTGLPNFRMVDEVTYVVPLGTRHNLFAEKPRYVGKPLKATIVGVQENDSDMIFKTKVNVGKNCQDCVLVLKQTYHPNWHATIDGKSVKPITVFPFYVAIPLKDEGTHEVVFWYQPSTLKITLVVLELAVLGCLAGLFYRSKRRFA